MMTTYAVLPLLVGGNEWLQQWATSFTGRHFLHEAEADAYARELDRPMAVGWRVGIVLPVKAREQVLRFTLAKAERPEDAALLTACTVNYGNGQAIQIEDLDK